MSDALFDRAKRAAGTAQGLALAAFIAIVATLAINYGFATFRTLARLPDGAGLRDALVALGPSYVSILPAIFFISALSRLRRALREYEKGEFFSPRSARAVRLAGEEAVLAMIAKIAIAPTILGWLEGSPFGLDFELVDLALVAFVFFVAAVGRVLDLAVAIKTDNDQIV